MTSRRPKLLLFVALLGGCHEQSATIDAGPPPQSLPTLPVAIGGKLFTLQIADEPAERETGLMHVRSMPINHGMLFVFPTAELRSFWMRDTLINLDIIYLNADQRVVSTHTMTAHDLNTTPSAGDTKFAIELNAGLAAVLKLKAGDRIELPAEAMSGVR